MNSINFNMKLICLKHNLMIKLIKIQNLTNKIKK